jgi:hypothetical protein
MLAWKEQTTGMIKDDPFVWDFKPLRRWMSEILQ